MYKIDVKKYKAWESLYANPQTTTRKNILKLLRVWYRNHANRGHKGYKFPYPKKVHVISNPLEWTAYRKGYSSQRVFNLFEDQVVLRRIILNDIDISPQKVAILKKKLTKAGMGGRRDHSIHINLSPVLGNRSPRELHKYIVNDFICTRQGIYYVLKLPKMYFKMLVRGIANHNGEFIFLENIDAVSIVLDNPTGQPAFEMSGYVKRYVIDGIQVPKYMGSKLSKDWKPSWVKRITNAEIQSLLVEKVGFERIMKSLRMVPASTYQGYTLYKKVSSPHDRRFFRFQFHQLAFSFLKMMCPSTGKVYINRVPPHIDTAERAIGWMNWDVAPEHFNKQQ